MVGMGFIFILIGIVGIVSFRSILSSFPADVPGGFQLASTLTGLIPIAIGILLVIVGAWSGTPTEPTTQTQQPTVIQEVIKVKVRCQYCGGLYDETMDKCPNCGAKR